MDVVIPFHEKDGSILPWCIRGITKNIEYSNIYVVSSKIHQPLIKKLGCCWVNEDEVIEGVYKNSLQPLRWGWYFQQFLKFGMANIVSSDHYLVVDSDTVFLRKTGFFNENGKPFYVPAHEYHLPYFNTIERLFPNKIHREYSFIAHHMVFSRNLVLEMLAQIDGDGKWPKKIINTVQIDDTFENRSNFSEYETYGHYVKATHPEEINLRTLKWANVQFEPNIYTISRLSTVFDYACFHSYQLDKLIDRSIISQLRYCYYFEYWLRRKKKTVKMK